MASVKRGYSTVVLLFFDIRLALLAGFCRRIRTGRNLGQQQDSDQHRRPALARVHGFSSSRTHPLPSDP